MSLDADLAAAFPADGDRGDDPFTLDVSLSVGSGETLAVLGPSGSGKSLLLEAVAGFHDHEGTVAVDGRPVTDAPPEERGFGFVFQEYALFPHLTARENVAFGARYHDGTADPDRLLADLGVGDLADRRPDTLSGGERQRVALARSLAIDPRVLLLDEPLSALDVPTRRRLREDLADVLADATAAYVTHDRTTARALGDRIAVLRDGRVEQVGDPEAVFQRPASPFVARFTGANCPRVGDLPPGLRPDRARAADRLAVRPEHVAVGPGDDATVERAVREDAAVRVRVRAGSATLSAFVADPPPPGERVGVEFPAERTTVFEGG